MQRLYNNNTQALRLLDSGFRRNDILDLLNYFHDLTIRLQPKQNDTLIRIDFLLWLG